MLREYQDEDPPEFIAVSPQYTILELDRETVMYKAGSRHIAFVGELYVELAALLDGTLTKNDIVALLSQKFDDASVEYAVNEVLAKGLARLTATAAAPMHTSAPAVNSSRAWTIVCMDDTSGNHEEPPRIEYDHNGILKPPGETDRPVGGPPKAFFGNPPIISRSQEPDHDVPEMDDESRIMRVDRSAVFSGSETNVRSSFARI